MRVVEAQIEDIDKLKPVAIEWQRTCNGKDFGLETNLETHLLDLAGLIERGDADLFLLLNEKDEAVGYMGITCFDSPIGSQRIAEEHYWFVSGKNRGNGALLLLRAIKEWAKEKGCSHLIMNASCLASEMHDKLCEFYEAVGFKKFETSYITALR